MRICMLTGYRGALDEGMVNVAFHVCQELEHSHQVLHLNARKSLFSPRSWRSIKDFHPHVVHIFLRPSIYTLALTRVLRTYTREARFVLSSFQPPTCPSLTLRFLRCTRPDLILTQSAQTDRAFSARGYKTAFLPSGVDTAKFVPVYLNTREKLREKYSVDKDKFVILHVGHILRERNLEVLNELQMQEEDNQVIIVGSLSFGSNKELYWRLRERGCLVLRSYLTNLEEMYELADCYVFPTTNPSNSIEIPLSVMEAMSCNLPVISTRFGALPEVFAETEGLIFVESAKDFASQLARLKQKKVVVNTRKKVLSYTWENVGAKLEELYAKVVG